MAKCVETGRGLQGGGCRELDWDLRGAPGSTPGHPAGLQTAGRGAEECPQHRGRASPSPSLPDPLGGTLPAPLFSEKGKGVRHPRSLRPPHPVPSHCNSGGVPLSGFLKGRHRTHDGVQEKQRPVEMGGGVRRTSREPEPGLTRANLVPHWCAAQGPGPARPAGSALPAGKLQRRKARVGQNPRAERPAPLPIPIHPARPDTTSLSLEEEFRKKGEENKSRCGERAASLRRREQRAGRLGPPRPLAPGALPFPRPPPARPSLAIHHSVPRQCRRGPAPQPPAPRPLALGFQRGRRGSGRLPGGDSGCPAAAQALRTSENHGPRSEAAPRSPTLAPSPARGCPCKTRPAPLGGPSPTGHKGGRAPPYSPPQISNPSRKPCLETNLSPTFQPDCRPQAATDAPWLITRHRCRRLKNPLPSCRGLGRLALCISATNAPRGSRQSWPQATHPDWAWAASSTPFKHLAAS